MKRFAQNLRRRRLSIALGTSALASGLLLPATAHAQCTPDPTTANGTTNCDGVDGNGVTVNTIGTQVVVAAGATVQAGTAPAAITVASIGDYLTVNGRVDGGGKAGIAVIAGPPITVTCDPYAGATVVYCYPGSTTTSNPSATAAITVAAGATVTGSQALVVARDASNTSGYVSASLYNSGTMTGTAGPALVSMLSPTSYGSLGVTNTATGFIGGMTGLIGSVDNAGIIDGTANAAIAVNGSYASIRNTGQILSTGAAATLSATDTLNVANATGATLGGGTTAISAGGPLTLTNTGTINGSVVSTATSGQVSTIDTRGGTINGNLTLGAGDDTLRADFNVDTGRISSITGTIDGGAGTDTLAIAISKDRTLGAVALPTNFELLGVDLVNNATVTLSPAFVSTGGVALGGYGSVVNQANLTTSGPAVVASSFGASLSFTNQASITATLSNSSQFAVGTPTNVTNSGSITAIGGNGVQVYATLKNTGTITASGIAASLYGTFDNSGQITSTGGTGVSLSNYGYTESTNSGSISGATTGVNLTGRLTNTATITGGTTGVALGYSGVLINAVGGTVTGGTTAVSNTGYSVEVVNAGTIDGNVNFASILAYDNSNDIFVDAGGTVNGVITLGGGDNQLVVDLAASPNRPLAGATNGVDAGAGHDTLRYRVNADASAALALPNGFEALAYELDNNAALALTAPGPITTTIGLTGNGTVTLNGAISGADHTLIDATIAPTNQLTLGTASPAQALTIISNGTLSLSAGQSYSYPPLRAINAGRADLTNNGAITVSTAAGSYYPATAIFGGGTVTNAGTITLDGDGGAINYARDVVNSGIITDTPGSNASGVSFYTTLDNSGIIRVDGNAVQGASYYGGSITNSGTIESRLATAVSLAYGATLTNAATGAIRGATAVDISSGGSIVNRGSIVGDIAAYGYGYGGAAYLADGGTVTGDVTFGASNDLFVETGTTTGVSGTVDGGAGEDTFGHVLTSSGIASLDGEANVINFEDALVQATGAGTVATVTATNPFAGQLYVGGDGTVVNQAAIGGVSGTVGNFANGGTITNASGRYGVYLSNPDSFGFTNSGTISSSVLLTGSGMVSVNNSGSLTASDPYGASPLNVYLGGYYAPVGTTAIVNSGTIHAILPADSIATGTLGVVLHADLATSATVSNTATGTIRADGTDGIGLYSYNVALTLDNAGSIGGGSIAADGSIAGGAVYSAGDAANTIRNTGTLDGAVILGSGDDMVENHGTITGPVMLGRGNDTFVQQAGAMLSGIVDGGSGTDTFVLDSTGNGALSASQLTHFEELRQTGTGTVSYAGTFGVGTIALEGGTLAVAAGQTLATQRTTTVTGGDSGVGIVNAGTIDGRVTLGSGSDTVVNLGTIKGSVSLGGGNDIFVEGVGSTVGVRVAGGDGIDLYEVMLAGDRTGIGARSQFEQLAVAGTGTLSLTLDQDFQSVALAGTGLNLSLGRHVVGAVTGSDAAETLAVDGDIASIALAAGDDTLALGVTRATGQYDGGAGNDMLRFTASAPIVLDGTATGFEQVALSEGTLTVNGTLGTADGALAFGAGSQHVTVANGGTIAGAIDLGAGDDSFTLAAGGTIDGIVSGGAGNDIATVEVAGTRTIAGDLRDFERFALAGTGTATLTGTQSYGSMTAATSLTVAAGGSLTTGRVTFGSGNDVFTIAGQFAGSVDGGAGTDTIAVSGGSASAPVAFGGIANVEVYTQSAGFATISGGAAFGSVDLAGGRLVGLAGSAIIAPQILVRSGATFGSAGTVTGNLAVQGTLSPGASPGTMRVNGNVSLAGGSTSLFELTPSVSDKLVVNGTLAIASDATLQLTPIGSLRPGTSYQLITASGGITGRYTTVVKPDSLFGVLVQRADSIDLLGQFVDPGTFAPQVSRSIAYANAALVVQPATSALFAALPALLTASGATNARAFAMLTPEPYASATQIALDDALTVTEALRGPALAASGTRARVYTFGQVLGGWRRLDGDPHAGTAGTQTHGYGLLGGIGFGDAAASVGAFGGYLNDTQRIDALGARTRNDARLAGLAGRVRSAHGFGVSASVNYEDGSARTDRALPAGGTAAGRYHLHTWVGDGTISYDATLASGWTVQPKLGVTYVRTTRDALAEASLSPFALTVARNRHEAVFVDGGLRFGRSDSSEAAFRPFVAFGVRYQVEGRLTSALASYAGGGLNLYALGAARANVVGTAAGGVAYRLPSGLDLFVTGSSQTGDGDNQEAVSAGVRLRF